MQFRGDRRGQAIQIGAVLLLGAIVISFGIYQATVVPEQNREIEFKHSQTVQDQLGDARNAIVSTGSTGDGRSVSVTLGTQYPSRLIAMNPGPPSGQLSTVGTTNGSITATIANANATGETGDFWTGANRSYNTGSLAYRPGYNEYRNAPTTWYEHSVLFNQFRDANLTETGQRLIDGTTISLVALNGSYQASQSGSVSLDFRGASVSSRTVSVTNTTGSNVTITLPTRLDEQSWEELLGNEPHFVDARTSSVAGADYQLVQIVLEQGVIYDLQLSRVGVGTGVVKPEPAYLTRLSENTPTVPEDGKIDITVEVRDRFDNPKRNVPVVAGTEWDNASVSPNSATSDGDGRVTVTYTAPNISGTSQKTTHVQVSLNTSFSDAVDGSGFNGSTPVNVSVPVRVDNSDGSGIQTGGDGGTATLRAGQGGESTYSPSQSTELLTDENGVWSAINKTDQITFSDGYPVVNPADGNESVLSEFTIANASEIFSVETEAYRTTDGTYGGTVNIYSFAADEQQTSSLTPAAAEDVLTADRYNGTDVINRASYASTDATFRSYLRAIAEMDRSMTEIIFSDQDGRVNLTLQGESLFTAVMANSSTANDEDEFVRLYFENGTDTGGWTISDTDNEASLPDERLQGEYYFTKNETALLNANPDLDPARVYNTSPRLADGGEALKLKDADRNLRDEIAYGTEQTTHGWSLTLGEDEVANRTVYTDGVYVDTDSDGDWTIETRSEFFDVAVADSITYNGDGTADGPNGDQTGVSFSVTNTGSSDANLTQISIDSSSAAIKVYEGNNGGGQWNREVFVNASTDGYVDTGEQNYNQDGYVLGSGPTPLNSTAVIGSSGGTGTISIYEFRDGNNKNTDTVNMTGEPVTVTLTFSDGSTKQIQFTG